VESDDEEHLFFRCRTGNQDGFILNVYYRDPQTGGKVNYLPDTLFRIQFIKIIELGPSEYEWRYSEQKEEQQETVFLTLSTELP
jgi:hypothetical protein